MANALKYALELGTRKFDGPLASSTRGLGNFMATAGKTALVLGPIAVGLGAITAAAGLTTGAFKALRVAADFESTKVSFGTLLGSEQKAIDLLKRIKDEAKSTPNSFNDLAGAARSLLAVSDEGGVIKDMRMIGDLASASQKPITELASLYAKILGGDIVQGEDLNQIGDALGGKALEEFAKVLGVDSVKAVRKLGAAGKINGEVLQTVFRNLTAQGGMAFGAMAAQSETTNGLFSTLKDSINDIYLTLGEPINDAIKPVLTGAIAHIQDLGARTAAFIQLLSEANGAGNFASVLGAGLELAAVSFINTFAGGIRGSVAYLGAALPVVMNAANKSLFSKNNMEAMGNIFAAGGAMLKAGILEGVAALADALGIAKGLAELLKGNANTERVYAETMVNNALGKNEEFGGGEGFDSLGDSIADMTQGIIDATSKGNAAFKEANSKPLIDPSEAREKFKDKTIGLDQELIDTILNGAPEKIDDNIGLIVESLKGKADEIGDIDFSVVEPPVDPPGGGGIPAPGVDEQKPKRSRLLNAADSLRSRYLRQSKTDKGSFDDFVNNSSSNRGVAKDYAKTHGLSMKDALAQLSGASKASSPRRRRGGGDAESKKAASAVATEATLAKLLGHFETIAVA